MDRCYGEEVVLTLLLTVNKAKQGRRLTTDVRAINNINISRHVGSWIVSQFSDLRPRVLRIIWICWMGNGFLELIWIAKNAYWNVSAADSCRRVQSLEFRRIKRNAAGNPWDKLTKALLPVTYLRLRDTVVETGEMLNTENSDRRGWLGFGSASPAIIQL